MSEVKLNRKSQTILGIILKKGILSSSTVHSELKKSGEDVSLVTVKRALSELVRTQYTAVKGSGRSTTYEIAPLGRIFAAIDAHAYCAIEPDKRYGLDRYNADLLPALPSNVFTGQEWSTLETATANYEKRTSDLSPAIRKKELERFIVELSWKSSKIEGNTYTLLDTERLILEHKKAPGHTSQEARMILNHKDAFEFVHENAASFNLLTRNNLERLHEILVQGLEVGRGLRVKPVGVTGSKYRPLDNIYQIEEALNALIAAVSRMQSAYAQALAALLGISYIQPFEDGNKRTARLAANALLLAHRKAPLSFRSVDEDEYKEAMLVFYEINSIMPARKIFVDQYEFAANNYLAI